jgi:tRNA pseudouridine38-40 synthase
MRTIKLTISYDGAAYKGWQLQKNGSTVQGKLEEALKKVFGSKHRLHGAGRTDSGVHARAQVAHFRISNSIPVKKIPVALNSVLPEDIAVTQAKEVPDGFHSRFDAKEKNYRYYIYAEKQRDPFHEKYSWRIPYDLDVSLMKKEAKELIGRHDFKSFQARDKKERSSVRTVKSLRIKKETPFVIIDIAADGFLYNMVRNIVGTLVDIGRGYSPPGSMKKILREKDRRQAGPTAPAKGLFLVRIKY